jgi:hypothetical protein
MSDATHGDHETGNTGSVRADQGAGGQRHQAGAFDIRVFIGSLLGVYGVILVLTALFSDDGRSVNLLTGIALVIAAVVFIVWARARPVIVPDNPDSDDDMERPASA